MQMFNSVRPERSIEISLAARHLKWNAGCLLYSSGLISLLLFLALAVVEISIAHAASADSIAADANDADRKRFDEMLQQGKQYLQQHDYDAASKIFEQALAIYPKNPEALYQMGVALVSGNHYREGVEYLERSLAQVPANLALRLILADVYEKGGLIDKSRAHLEQIIAMAPTTPQASEAEVRLALLLSRQYVSEGRIDQALELLTAKMKKYPDDTRLMNHMGIALLAANRFDEAEKVLKRQISLAPDDASAHLNLALLYINKDQMDLAVPLLEKILKIAPNSDVAKKAAVQLDMYRGRQALESGDSDRALKEFRAVVAIDPGNILANLTIASIHHQAGRVQEAEAIYKQIIKIAPDNIEARLRLGRLYAETNRFPEAITEFKFIVERGGNLPQAQQAKTVLIRLLMETGNRLVGDRKLDEAIAAYRDVAKYDPDNAEGHRRLGLLLQNQRQFEEASHEFEELIRIAPLNADAYFLLAKNLDAMNQLDKAVAEYSRALALEQDEKRKDEIIVARGLANARSLLSDNKIAEGKQEVEALLEKYPENPLILFFLALINTQQNDYNAAVSEYEQLLQTQPDHLRARFNLAFLYERLTRDEDAISEYRKVIQSASADVIVDQARERLALVEQRLSGTDYAMSYSMAFDDNSNLSETTQTKEFRTDLNFNFAYHYTTRNKIRYRLVFSPNYAMFHEGHFDFLTLSFSGYATVLRQNKNFGAGLTHQTRTGLLTVESGSTSDNLSLDASWNLDRRDLRARASLSTQDSEVPSIFDSDTFSIGATFNQLIGESNAFGFDYDYTDNDNKLSLGSDYAYREHAGSIRLESRLTNRMSGNVRYSLSMRNYKNADSFSGFVTKRENILQSVRIGLNYRYSSDLSYFGSYSYSINDSNLPVGVILDSVDLQQIVGPQSSSLGNYERGLLSFGMSLYF